MLPIFKLIPAHKKGAPINIAEINIIAANFKLPLFKAHWLRAITTATALMEHEFAMRIP